MTTIQPNNTELLTNDESDDDDDQQPTITSSPKPVNVAAVDVDVAAVEPVFLTTGISDLMKKRLLLLPAIVQDMNCKDDLTKVLTATEQMRKLLSIERRPPIDDVIATGIVPRMIELITDKYDSSPELQFEAAWALTNIVSGTSDHTKLVVDAGALPWTVRLLESPNADCRAQSVWFIGNVAGDSVKFRDLVLESGALPLLLRLSATVDGNLSLLRNCMWSISNLMRGTPRPELRHVITMLPYIAQLVRSRDEDILTDASWAYSYCCTGTVEEIDAMIQSGVVPRLIELLHEDRIYILTPMLRVLGNIASSANPDHVNVFLQHENILPRLLSLLEDEDSDTLIIKETCSTIGKIAGSGPSSRGVETIINAHLLHPVIELMTHHDFTVRKEAVIAISNITFQGTIEHLQHVVMGNGIELLCQCLSEEEETIVMNSLIALENILSKNIEVEKVDRTIGNNKNKDNNEDNKPLLLENDDGSLISAKHLVEQFDGINNITNLQESKDDELRKKALHVLEINFGEAMSQPKSAGRFI
jgi:importin subunit alpha-1